MGHWKLLLSLTLIFFSASSHGRKPTKPAAPPKSALSHCEELVDDVLTLEKQRSAMSQQGKTYGELQKEREQLISEYHALEGVEAIINQYLHSALTFTYRPAAEVEDLLGEMRQLTSASANYHGLRGLFYHFSPAAINDFLSAPSSEAFLTKITNTCAKQSAASTELCQYFHHADEQTQKDFRTMLTGFFLAVKNIPPEQRADQFYRPAADAFAGSSVDGWGDQQNYQATGAARQPPPLAATATAEMRYQDQILGEITQALRLDRQKQAQCQTNTNAEQETRCLKKVQAESLSKDAFNKYQVFLNSFRQKLSTQHPQLTINPDFDHYQEVFNQLQNQYRQLLDHSLHKTVPVSGQISSADQQRLRQALVQQQENLEGNLRLMYLRQNAHLQQRIHLEQQEAKAQQTDCENPRNHDRKICRPINKLKEKRAHFQQLLARTNQPGIGPLVDLYQDALKDICPAPRKPVPVTSPGGAEIEKALLILARCQGTNYSGKIAQAKAQKVQRLAAVDQQFSQLIQTERYQKLQRFSQLLMAQLQAECQNSNHLDLINCCEVYQGTSSQKGTHQYWALYDSSNQIIAQLDSTLVPATGLTIAQRQTEIEQLCQQGPGLRQCQFTKKRDAFVERGKTYHQTSGKDRLTREFPERRTSWSNAFAEGFARSLMKSDTMPTVGMMVTNSLYTDYLTTQAINYKTQLYYQDAWNNAWWDMMSTGSGSFPVYPGSFTYGLKYGYGGYNPFYASNFGYSGTSTYRNGFSFSTSSSPTLL